MQDMGYFRTRVKTCRTYGTNSFSQYCTLKKPLNTLHTTLHGDGQNNIKTAQQIVLFRTAVTVGNRLFPKQAFLHLRDMYLIDIVSMSFSLSLLLIILNYVRISVKLVNDVYC